MADLQIFIEWKQPFRDCIFYDVMVIWYIFVSKCLRIIDGWIGSRISCLIIAEVYLQIYCNNDTKHKTAQNFEILNILLWIVAASIYKLIEYLIMNWYFKSYVNILHLLNIPFNNLYMIGILDSLYYWFIAMDLAFYLLVILASFLL